MTEEYVIHDLIHVLITRSQLYMFRPFALVHKELYSIHDLYCVVYLFYTDLGLMIKVRRSLDRTTVNGWHPITCQYD